MNLGQVLIKALLCAAIVGTLLPWFGGAPIVTSAVAGAVLGVISWVGDVTFRNWMGNILAAVVDGGVAYLYLRIAPWLWPTLAAVPFSAVVITSLALAIAEFFYHRTLPSPQRERV